MDVLEAIRTRRTIAKFRPEPIPRDLLIEILATGIWAPNHKLTEPWRFVILGPETQAALAERFGDLKVAKAPADSPERRERMRAEHVHMFRNLPAVVAVAAQQEGEPQRLREDMAAVCCAVQNVQLAAWAAGIGMKWSTAGVTRDPLAYRLLGLDPARFDIIGFLFAGYPAEVPTRERRLPLDEVIRTSP
jgi:nitroreductase